MYNRIHKYCMQSNFEVIVYLTTSLANLGITYTTYDSWESR